jgi:ADP-glucose pyrophosphorylase
MIRFLPVLVKIITINYEIAIILVKLPAYYPYLNNHYYLSTIKLLDTYYTTHLVLVDIPQRIISMNIFHRE